MTKEEAVESHLFLQMLGECGPQMSNSAARQWLYFRAYQCRQRASTAATTNDRQRWLDQVKAIENMIESTTLAARNHHRKQGTTMTEEQIDQRANEIGDRPEGM